MSGAESKHTISEMGVDARLLLQRIQKMQIGQEYTYTELAQAIGRDVRPGSSGYAPLVTARRAAEREGRVVDVIPKVGIRRMDDVRIVKSASGMLEKIHRISRRGSKRLSRVGNFDALPNEVKIEHNAKMSMLGVLMLASSARAEKKITGKVQQAQAFLPVAKTLEELK